MIYVTQRWTYLGPEGTFTEQAVRSLRAGVDDDVELVPTDGVAAAIADLRAGRVDGSCVPLENSVEGSVPLTLDELTHGEPLLIGAEAYVTVQLDLLVRPGTVLTDIRQVGSHPHGHAQIRTYLTAHLPDVESVVFNSTAAAAAAVGAGQLDAAAAAPAAGRRYELDSIVQDIGEVRGAVTRFVLLRRPGTANPARTGNDRTSLVVYVEDDPGSLLSILAELANRGINLSRLESRPARSQLGKYFFLLDADGHVQDAALADALAALHRRSLGVRFLGSYPRGVGRSTPVPPFASAEAFERAAAFVEGARSGQVQDASPAGVVTS